jgi:transmembrane sensor
MHDNPIWEQAMDWHERLRACPRDAELKAEIARWCAKDPAHERAWARVNRVWDLAGPPASAPHSEVPRFDETSKPRRWTVLAGTIAASLALVLALPQLLVAFRADHATGTAATRTIALADGSTVLLAPESALAVDFSKGRRQVELLRGRAFFDVAHDASSPFTVRAGDDQVSVLGTAFDVTEGENALTVSVARGSVRVTRGGNMLVPILRAGEELRAPLEARGAQLRSIDPHQPGDWRNGRLKAENMRISDLVEEVGRNYSGAIIVGDSSLGEKRVTGIFDLGDPEAALASAARPFGVKVRRITPWLLVIG